jgi:hypothetical protein
MLPGAKTSLPYLNLNIYTLIDYTILYVYVFL